MFKIMKAAFDVFRAGQAVSNPAFWKNAQLVGTLLAALVALAAAFGFDLGLSDDEIAGGAIFIVAVVNGIIVVVTSKKVGLPAKQSSIEAEVEQQIKLLLTKNPQKLTPNDRNAFGFPTDRNG